MSVRGTYEVTGPATFSVDLTDKTAVTSAPSGASAGVAVSRSARSVRGADFAAIDSSMEGVNRKVQIAVEFTRSSGDGTCTIWVYGYVTALATWYRLERLPQMDETGTDMNHAFQLEIGEAYSRIATRVAEISGTGAKVVATRIGFSN